MPDEEKSDRQLLLDIHGRVKSIESTTADLKDTMYNRETGMVYQVTTLKNNQDNCQKNRKEGKDNYFGLAALIIALISTIIQWITGK